MKVIAVDPGYDRLGVAIIERQNNKETVIYSTCLMSDKALSLPERILTLGEQLTGILTQYTPKVLAIETLFFNKNVKTALGVAQARGMIVYLAGAYGCTVHEYSPQQVKVAVTGYGNSDKPAVTAMVKRLAAGVPGTAHDDEYDAIAVGITCLAHIGVSR